MAQADEPIDDDNPETTETDWVGAAEVRPGAETISPADPIMFHVYVSSVNGGLYAVTGSDRQEDLPPCPGDGEWRPFKQIRETGQPRIGFSEAEARADIERQGYHLTRVSVEVRESA